MSDRRTVLWTQEMYDNLTELLTPVQALITAYETALRDHKCGGVDELGPYEGSPAPHPLESAWVKAQESFNSVAYVLADLAACVQWAPGHAYHEAYSPVTPYIRELRTHLKAGFANVLAALRAVEADAIRMEIAAEHVERGNATISGAGQVVLLNRENR